MYTKGDILKGEGIVHRIVYLDNKDDYYFIASMLTHSTDKKYPNNISLKSEHFEKFDENNNKFEFVFENTYFVKLKLEKKIEWGPYSRMGKLTSEGIKFLEDQLKSLEPTEWRKYMVKAS